MQNILLALCFLLVFSCKDDSQNQRLKNVLNFEPELWQQFTVHSDSIISIVGKKGTKITFNPNDLEGILDGPNVRDTIRVNLIELTNKEDLLRANTQTLSNNKWLISGGAFNIEIDGYGPLELKDGKTISVQFPMNSTESSMQIFYGDRDDLEDMNWKESEIKVEEKKYFTIYYKESELSDDLIDLDYKGEDVASETLITIDTLGFTSLSEFENKYTRIDTMFIKKDTLRGLESYLDIEEIRSYKTKEDNYTNLNKIYEVVKVSKLGWINIDKFAPEEVKVSINLKFNINIDSHRSYIIDNENNTILNVYKNEVEIPVNRSFTILSFGIKDDTFYGYKKSVRFNKNDSHKIELKKVSKENIKSLLKLD